MIFYFVKGLEVTIDSFVWSERVQKVEQEIRQICDASDFKQEFCPVNADQLLVADSGNIKGSREILFSVN
jgi:hypothetical protein